MPNAVLREVKVRYDSDQAAAVAVKSNVVVSAGAGAGKTSVLVGRYVRLVADDHIPVDEILTLTFTRKAATEMHERIYRALGEVGDNPFVREQLERFDSAVISTLDSFCGSVARSGSTAFGLAPSFAVDEAKLDSFCDDLSLRFLLGRKSAASETVQSLVRLNRFEPLWREGFAELAKDHFLVSRELDLPKMVAAQRDYLLTELVRYTGELEVAIAAIQGLDPEVAKCISGGQQIIAGIDREELSSGALLSDLKSPNNTEPVSHDLRNRLSQLIARLELFSGVKKSCGSSRNADVVLYKSYVDDLHSCRARLRDLIITLGSWHEVAAAGALAGEFQSLVTAQKRRSGILSYHDVTALAISVLEKDTDLRRYYKNRFKAIMIDEFQDNNEEQKKLLYLLAERPDHEATGVPSPEDLAPDKLFFVGDEKQSFYRFRGADVSVFKRLSDELRGETISLGSNYRSEPGLILFFNAFFSRIFTEPDPDYEARFSPLGSRAATEGLKPSVELWRLVGRDKDPELMSEDEAEAYHIARFISNRVAAADLLIADTSPSGEGDPSDLGSGPVARPANYRDFAIIMRSTGNQMRIERMLRLFGVPYVAQTARSLFLEAPMNDIYTALQLVLYPQDRVALASFLRSPMVGMTDDGVVRVLAADPNLFGDVAGLTAFDLKRYQLAAGRNAELSALADTVRLTDLIHHIWYHWGYRYHLLRRDEYATYLEHYDYIYELARLYEERGLAAFLASIRTSIGRNKRLDELNIVRDESDGVNIMTIHKAKGLEFPVVIVANTGNRGRTDSVSSAPFYRSDRHGLVFNVSAGEARPREKAVNFIYGLEHEEAMLQDVAELRRLLYVAATRAESHLIFSGFQRGNDRSPMAMLAPAFAAAADEIGESPEISIAIRELEPVPISARTGASSSSRDIARLAANYAELAESGQVTRREYARRAFTPTELNAAYLELDLPGDSAPVTGRELSIDGSAETGLADRFGTFAHYCVQQLGAGTANAGTLRSPAALPAPIRPPLEGKPLARFLAEGVELAQGFLQSDLFRQAGEANAEFELPFLLRVDTRGVQSPDHIRVRGQIDLVFEFRDRVIVVDFKTDRELHSSHYAVQMELYRRATRAIYGKPSESVLYHLRSGTSLSVDDEVGDELLARLVALIRNPGLY